MFENLNLEVLLTAIPAGLSVLIMIKNNFMDFESKKYKNKFETISDTMGSVSKYLIIFGISLLVNFLILYSAKNYFNEYYRYVYLLYIIIIELLDRKILDKKSKRYKTFETIQDCIYYIEKQRKLAYVKIFVLSMLLIVMQDYISSDLYTYSTIWKIVFLVIWVPLLLFDIAIFNSININTINVYNYKIYLDDDSVLYTDNLNSNKDMYVINKTWKNGEDLVSNHLEIKKDIVNSIACNKKSYSIDKLKSKSYKERSYGNNSTE